MGLSMALCWALRSPVYTPIVQPPLPPREKERSQVMTLHPLPHPPPPTRVGCVELAEASENGISMVGEEQGFVSTISEI